MILTWFLYAIPIAIALFLLKKRAIGRTCNLSPNLKGKIAIVTGANCGIGYHTAARLARLGATVVIACRDPQRTEPALQSLREESKSSLIDFIKLDLSSKKSIQEFVDTFKTKYDRLDILVNNAGLFNLKRVITAEGFEQTFGVNHLGHFMLTFLLCDYLLKSALSRVVNVSSEASLKGTINFEDLMGETSYTLPQAYAQSKLANVLFAQELNRKYEQKGVKSVSLHPGRVKTEISRPLKSVLVLRLVLLLFSPITWFFVRKPKQGAQTTIHCCLVDHDKLEGGEYYDECSVAKMNPVGRDQAIAKRLWDVSLDLLALKDTI